MTTRDSSYWTPERLALLPEYMQPEPEEPKKSRTTRDGLDRLDSGRWRGRYTDKDGKRHTFTRDTYAEAKAHRETQMATVHLGRHVAPRDGRTTFKAFAEEWLAGHGGNQSTIDSIEGRLRVHVYPTWGDVALADVKPTRINAWLRSLDHLAASTRKGILGTFSAVLAAAVDDDMLATNPAAKRSVKAPRREASKVVPWTAEQVLAVREGLPEQYRILATLGAGLGLRQGELFGLSPNDVDFLRGKVTVQRQVKVYGSNRLAFALPKGGKVREVPLPGSVRDLLAEHLAARPAVDVTLPWEVIGGRAVTAPLVVSSREGKALNRNHFNGYVWKPALRAAGLPDDDRAYGTHALRHFYASALLDAGESIKAVSEYLGHADAGFTLRVYTHLMPSSEDRTRKAIDAALSANSVSLVTDRSSGGHAAL